MPAALDIAAFTLSAVAIACAVYSAVVLWRVRRGRRAAPDLERWQCAPEPAGGWPMVCVVVPAHNEERVIARLAESLKTQDYPSLSVVYALDRCDDGTRAEIVRVHGENDRVEIVEIDACPEGWAGKTHAAHAGVTRSAAAANADLLLFTDADTWFHPRCLRAAAAATEEKGLAMLSLLSTLDAHALWEVVAQPVAAMALLRQHPLDRVNSKRTRRAFANGQFILFRADAYRQIGGHEAVKDAILEDLQLAKACKRAGLAWAVHPAGAMLRCRMYETLGEFRNGWRRIFIESARRRPSQLRGWAAELALTGVVLPLGSLAAFALGAFSHNTLALAAGALGLAAWGVSVIVVWRAMRAPALAALLAPLGAIEVARVLAAAARDLTERRTVRWGGREYQLEPQPRRKPRGASAG